jgi:hypothetical protein
MADSTVDIIANIESLLLEIRDILSPGFEYNSASGISILSRIHTKISVTLDRYAPKGSTFDKTGSVYLQTFEQDIIHHRTFSGDLTPLEGLLISLKEAYSNGYFKTIDGMISTEIFSDFLEMAESFLSQGDQYKHSAAFLIGGVLEEHLRKLSIKNEIPIMKDGSHSRKAEDLNIDLKKKGVYTEGERKTITALLDIRNNADHAHWEAYSLERVKIMLMDVRRILMQYPV